MDIDRRAPVNALVETFINAPPAVVWTVLADISAWPVWNPDLASVNLEGPVAPGTAFHWKAGGLPITSRLQVVEPEQRIGWTGKAPPGIRAVHLWHLTPEDGGTRVRTEESFDGFLARFLPGLMRRMLARSLESGLAALKAEAERRAG